MDYFYNIIANDEFPDMGKQWKPLIPYHRERYLTPETLKKSVLNGKKMNEIYKHLSGGDRKKEAELQKAANGMLQEIGFTRNMAVIRFLGIVLNKILKQTISGVYVNKKSIKTVKRVLGQGQTPVLYLPSHRSYADFVLMSYIFFVHNLEIPAIAAGMDFHGMVGMGSALRATGAFFMRRSFSSTDSVYWDVFKEYVRSIVTEYHTGMEFFVEGTRSRSCKALPPKIGLLSMALEPLFSREIYDLKIVPVGVAYERPLEEQLFAYELLGVPKPKESTKGLFKGLEALEINHGNIYINFGTPLSVADYFLNRSRTIFHSNFQERVILTKERLKEVRCLSCKVVDEQQRLIVITTFNLIVIYFTYRSYLNETVDLVELQHGASTLADFLNDLGALVAKYHNGNNIESKIIESLNVHSNIVQLSKSKEKYLELVKGATVSSTKRCDASKLKGHDLAQKTMRSAIPSIVLQLYCNPCMFWLHQPAFFVMAEILHGDNYSLGSARIFDEVKKLKDIFSMEFIVAKDNTDSELHRLQKTLQYLPVFKDSDFRNMLLSAIVPFIYSYYNVVDVILSKFPKSTEESDTIFFAEKELFVSIQMTIENRLNDMHRFVHPYCLSLDCIGNALQSFVSNGIIVKMQATKDKPTVMYSTKIAEMEMLRVYLHRYCSIFNHFNVLSNYLCLAKM